MCQTHPLCEFLAFKAAFRDQPQNLTAPFVSEPNLL